MKCPNKNHPDYVKLVEQYGEVGAMKAYVLNGEDIPTLDAASKLIGKSLVKSGINKVFTDNPELAKIGTEQQYAQYISGIFPESTIDKIVYHGTNTKFDKFEKGFGKWSDAFWFDTKGSYKQKFQIQAIVNSTRPFSYNITQVDEVIKNIYGQEELDELHKYYKNPSNRQFYLSKDEFEVDGDIVTSYGIYDTNGNFIKSVKTEKEGYEFINKNSPERSKVKQDVINLYESYTAEQHPDVEGGQFIKKEGIKELQDAGFDSIIYHDYLAIFEPEQIHILGSKQDIEGFKDYINKTEYKQSISNQPSEVDTDFNKKLDIFRKSLGDIEVIFDESLESYGELQTRNGKRVVVVNPTTMKQDTVGHEFGHLLIELIGGLQHPLAKRGLALLKDTELERRVRATYPDVSEEVLQHEILAQAIGEDSVKLFEDEQKRNSFERWLVRVFERIKQLLGLEKSAVRRLTRMMFTGGIKTEPISELSNTTYEQRKSELITDEKLVKKAIDVIMQKRAIYEHTNSKSALERMNELLLELPQKTPKESLMKFVGYAERQASAIYTLYERELAKEQEGKEAFDIPTLNKWHTYLSAFEILDDIRDYVTTNPDVKIETEFRNRLNEAIAKRDMLTNLYRNKGYGKLVDWLMPFSGRIEAEIKRSLEREYNTLPEKDRSNLSLLQYQEAKMIEQKDEIEERKRVLIETELLKARSDINQIYRWADNLLDSNDTIIQAAVKALVMADEQARLKSLKTKNKIVSALRELETVIKHNPVRGEEEFYDFVLEKDSNGKYTGNLLSEYHSDLIKSYYEMRSKAEEIEDSITRSQVYYDWYDANAPLDRGKYKKNLEEYYNKLKNEGSLSEADVSILMTRYNASPHDPIKRKTMKELIGDEKTDIVNDGIAEVTWASRNVNKKYLNKKWVEFEKFMRANPTHPKTKFYNLIVKLSDEADNKLPTKYKLNFHGLVYRLPSVAKDTRERVKDKGVKGFIKGQKVGLIKRPEDIERGQQELVGENNEPIDFIPIFYTQPMDVEDLSFDLATSYNLFSGMAEHYLAKSEILPQMELARYFIKSREVIRTDAKGNPIKNALKSLSDKELTKNGQQSLIASQFEDWYKTIMHGQSKVDEGEFNIFGLKVDKGKAADMLGKYSAFNLLALNAIQGVGNVLLGETMQAIEAFAGQYMTKKSYTKATALFTKKYPEFLGDIGSRAPKSLLGLLNEKFNIVNEGNDPLRRNTRFRSLLTSNSLFFMQHAGEFEMQMRFFLGMLYDLDAKDSEGKVLGKMTDFIEVKDGELHVKKEVANFTEKDQIEFNLKVKRVISRMHGEYSNHGTVALQRYGIGRLVLAFRKFIIPGFKRRWAKEAYNEFLGDFTEGNYITTAKFVKTLLKDIKAFKMSLVMTEWSKLTAAEKANIHRTISEIVFMTAALILSTIFLTLAKEADDDDEDKKWSFAAYQASRYLSEIQFFVNPVAALSILRSPMASMSVVENSIKLLSQLAHPTETYERGPWKDQLKIKKDLINLTVGVRQYYRLRDIEQQLSYFNQ